LLIKPYLGAGKHDQVEAAFFQFFIQCADGLMDHCRACTVSIAPKLVRRRHNSADAIGDQGLTELCGLLEGRGAVVKARQAMAMGVHKLRRLS